MCLCLCVDVCLFMAVLGCVGLCVFVSVSLCWWLLPGVCVCVLFVCLLFGLGWRVFLVACVWCLVSCLLVLLVAV